MAAGLVATGGRIVSSSKTEAVISACEKSADWPWALEILETQRPGQPLDNNLTCRDVRFLETPGVEVREEWLYIYIYVSCWSYGYYLFNVTSPKYT